jgi:thiol-disulfide isomerase/thioredoxin
MYLALVVVFLAGAVLKRLLFLRSYIVDAFDAIAGEKLPPEVYWNSLFGSKMFGHVWHSVEVDAKKKAQLGNKAINSPLVSLEDGKYHRLLDFAQNKRPLVVNFGSCTCPVFMKKIDKYAEIIADYKDVADFVTVYIEEAHPQDGWAFEVSSTTTFLFQLNFLATKRNIVLSHKTKQNCYPKIKAHDCC